MSLPAEKALSFSFCSRPEEREPLLSAARSFEQPQDTTAANLLDRELTPITREYKKNACTPDYNQEQINFKKRHGFVTDFSGFSLDVLTNKIQNAFRFRYCQYWNALSYNGLQNSIWQHWTRRVFVTYSSDQNVCLTLICTWVKVKEGWCEGYFRGGGGRAYFQKKLCGSVRSVSRTLTPLKNKICDLPYPLYDQLTKTSILHLRVHP